MKIVNILLGVLVILVGLWPFFSGQFKQLAFIPSQGSLYSGLVVLAGVIIVIYNVKTRESRLRFR